jgi:DAPG hydrolase PhiG domain
MVSAYPDADEVITADRWSDDSSLRSPTLARVTTVDELAGITPEMFGWWFAHLDEAGYQRFHPHDHKDFAWTRGKQPGRYVGATHRTHHQYGGVGPVVRSEISFVEPSTMFGAAALAALATTIDGVALSAVIHLLDERDRPHPAEAGRFTHVALRRPYGLELRSRWWLVVGPGSDLGLMTTSRMRHVHEEFGYLAGFLPELYAGEGQDATENQDATEGEAP